MKTGPSKRKPQKAIAMALLLACLLSLAASAPMAYARTVAQKKQAAKGYLEQADKLRDALLGTPEGDREKRDYQKAIDAYRKVYYIAPSYAKADAAVLAVAELLDDQGRIFKDDKSFKDAIGQLVFLRREYPGSKYRVGALYTIAEIYRDDLKDKEQAKAGFEDFLKHYPHAQLALKAKQALAEIEDADASSASAGSRRKNAKKQQPSRTLEPKAAWADVHPAIKIREKNAAKSEARKSKKNDEAAATASDDDSADEAASVASAGDRGKNDRASSAKSGTSNSDNNDQQPAPAQTQNIAGANIPGANAPAGLPPVGRLPRLTSVRHWSTPDYVRVAIDLEQEVKYEAGRVPHPDRIFFDLYGIKLASDLVGKTFDVEAGFLHKIRVAQYKANMARVVLDVDDVAEYSAFLLPNPYRLIIDIHGKVPARQLAKNPAAEAKQQVAAEARQGSDVSRIIADAKQNAADGGQSSSSGTMDSKESAASSNGSPSAASGVTSGTPGATSSSTVASKDAGKDSSRNKDSQASGSDVTVRQIRPGQKQNDSAASALQKAGDAKSGPGAGTSTKTARGSGSGSTSTTEVAKNEAPKMVVDDTSASIDATDKATTKPTSGPTYEAVAPQQSSRNKKTAVVKPDSTASKQPVTTTHTASPTANGERSLIRALGLKIGRIVVDAGHGGHDTGTIGPNGLLEKDLVLDVALKLGKELEDKLGAEVVYTRDDDTFIPLETRTAVANKEQADLFISIHANSSSDESARGVETYYLNFTSSRDALDVAARENSVSEKSIHELQDLVKKIALKEKIEESREFAADVQKSLYTGLNAKNPGIRNRGVKKAPFIVLIGANMPSILAEISFVSNPADEKKLKTQDYRQRIADSLYKGVAKYINGLSGIKVAASRVDHTDSTRASAAVAGK
jgi:N-acetylmuramoyl-L-alanine amidase